MFRKGGLDLKAYNEMIRSVEYHKSRIRFMYDQIDAKIKSLEAKMNYLIKNGEIASAENYKREIRLLKRLKNILYNFELGLIAVIERLDTLRIILQALDGFKPAAKAIHDAVNAAYYIPGNFHNLLQSLADSYYTLIETVRPPEATIYINLENPEAEEIISQVEKEVSKIVYETFPSIQNINILTSPKKKVEELLSAIATDGGFSERLIVNKPRKSKPRFEDQVYYYMKYISRGKIDVFGCARYLGTSPQRVIEALYTLAEENKIKFNS